MAVTIRFVDINRLSIINLRRNDFKAISGVEVSVVIGARPAPEDMGTSVVIGAADIKRGAEVSVGAMAASGSAGACGGAKASCAADNGAIAPTADGAGAAARLEAENEINPLITNVMTNKKVASAVAKRKTGTMRGVGGLMPAICGVKVKLRGARREGS